MTSQPGLQTIAIHILPNISQSKYNQTVKFGQLIEYNKRNYFLQKLCGKWDRGTSSTALFFFVNLIWGEDKCLQLSFVIFRQPLTCRTSKTNYKALDAWSRDMGNFNYSEKGLELVSPPYFVYGFGEMLIHFIKWPNLIVWLSLLLKILGNMCITIVC